MTINKTLESGTVTLTMKGKLSTTTSPQFQEALTSALNEAKQIILDFKEVDYVASAGLRVLLLGEKNAKASGKIMTLINVSADIMEIFDVTGFTGILNIK